MNPQITISDQTPEEVEPVSELLRLTWLDTYPNEEFGITVEDIKAKQDSVTPEYKAQIEKRKANVNTDPNIHSWVAKYGEKIVGFCAASREKQDRIWAIYVLPEYQGKKVGKTLFVNALEWIGEADKILINVASYNDKAINFYKSFGFTESGNTVHSEAAALSSGVIIPEIELVKLK